MFDNRCSRYIFMPIYLFIYTFTYCFCLVGGGTEVTDIAREINSKVLMDIRGSEGSKGRD